jgi:hypothetical protein
VSIASRLLPTLLAGSALLACGTLTGGTSGPGPTSSQASELALSMQDEVENALPMLTLGAPGRPHGFPVIAGCPAPGSTTDGDGDGIPNNETLTFLDPPCTEPGYRGGTIGLTGTVTIQDTSANSTSYNLTLADLTWSYVDSGATRSYTEVRNGTRIRAANGNAASIATTLVTQRQRPPLATATVTLTTTTSFNGATAPVVGQPLPSGSLTVAGTLVWHRSTEDWNLAIATPVPLQYDATCTTTPQRIKSGRVTLTGTVNSGAGVLTITWNSCGTEPARQWTATP